ncbi:SusC/RagA family TonB-linked outer membrane protein [Chryseobacterium sp. RP-3-3]|uniref:SusC/RagA family TonB-linked outer membrane protein n=1 Tax=Chryseobacterium antibioticum TaxID=2728847 RepID=A0A7Y0FRZ6_9FLAO|nr:SusC/RagA family TonB-linked outer membrane protein [Chryseobacterium antibioticum]NML70767.1 SusC/RagA family TonB-linked outer membrane protein [Chryseobacterium antibioticum]
MKKNFCSLGHIQLAFGFTLLVSCTAIGQVREISGTVTENNLPVKGVSVFQQGSDAVALTSASGKYVVRVSGEDPVLIFQHHDYGERRVFVRNGNVFNISLSPAEKTTTTNVGEVVLNAGYYKVKDKERTGSIAKVSAKDIENQPVGNVLSAAQGRVAGVNIVQNSGMPGGGYDIQIRGKNSLRSLANSPLYVVDGVPVGGEMASQFSGSILPASSINPLNSINPSDVESIEILKDADATSIYGSRGANGVVLITTKKGKSGKSGKLDLNIGTSYSVSSVISNLKMLGTADYIRMRKQAYVNDGVSVYPPNAYDINGIWDQTRNTDWKKALIGNTADAFNTHISLSGGNDRTSFLVGYGHSEQSTVFSKNFKYTTDHISSSISHSSEDKRFQLTVSNRFSLQKNNLLSEDITRQSLLLPPDAPALYLEDGSLNWENNTFNNPAGLYNSSYSYESKQFLTQMNMQYELLEHWFLKLSGGINYQSFDERSLKPNTMYNPASYQGQSSANSQSYKSSQDRFSYILEPQLNWQRKTGRHAFDVLVGTTFQSEVNRQGSMQGFGFESNAFIENIGAARYKIITDQIKTQYRYAAFFGRINYQYAGRYIINLTGRRDGSSRFGPNNKFANFGAVGAAWIFSQEAFLKDKKWLSFGKLRTSYGSTGSDNIGDYGYLDTYDISESLYNNTAGLNPSRLYNPNYSWEKTTKLEAALELGLVRNRINLTTAWYRNRSSSQLVGYQLPSVTGFSSVLANLNATVENSGWELELSAKPFSGSGFQWETGFNISFPENRLVSFPGLEGSTYANTYMIGQPITMVKVYQYEGIDPSTGLYRFKDFNGDGKISAPDDRKAVENIGVRYFGGWNNTLRLGNWNLSFLFQFVKQKNWNYQNIMPIPGSMNNQPKEVLDVWSTDHPDGTYMPYSSGTNGTKNQLHVFFMNSTAAVSDASFVRLKNLELGYQIPVKGVLKNAKVYFQGQNLLTFTRYFGPDPEFRNIGYLPPLKTYSLGVLISL